mgnify:CR=1 FL=1
MRTLTTHPYKPGPPESALVRVVGMYKEFTHGARVLPVLRDVSLAIEARRIWMRTTWGGL